MTYPAIISPATEGTNDTDDGTGLSPGAVGGVLGGSSLHSTSSEDTPLFFSAERTALASGHVCVLLISVIRNLSGYNLFPVPIEDITGTPSSEAQDITATLLFTVSTADNWVKVENKGDSDITNDIYVYYKNKDGDTFNGGITYRVKFTGGIPAGESKEEQTMHYDPSTSEIMYLTYE